MEDLELIRHEDSKKIRFPRSVPYIRFSLNGSSYLNSKAAALLELKHGGAVAFYHTPSGEWFIENNDSEGSIINKTAGLYKFSNSVFVRRLFNAVGVSGNKCTFRLASQIEIKAGKKVLFISPKCYNIE